jgi:hypothetical protein
MTQLPSVPPTLPESLDQNPSGEFTDNDLKRMLLRTQITLAIFAALGAVFAGIAAGWQSAVLLIIGAAVSAIGIWEWRSMVITIMARMDARPGARPASVALAILRFFLRFLLAAAVLYVSLKRLHGSPYALVAGLALGVVALMFEAVKLLRQWR